MEITKVKSLFKNLNNIIWNNKILKKELEDSNVDIKKRLKIFNKNITILSKNMDEEVKNNLNIIIKMFEKSFLSLYELNKEITIIDIIREFAYTQEGIIKVEHSKNFDNKLNTYKSHINFEHPVIDEIRFSREMLAYTTNATEAKRIQKKIEELQKTKNIKMSKYNFYQETPEFQEMIKFLGKNSIESKNKNIKIIETVSMNGDSYDTESDENGGQSFIISEVDKKELKDYIQKQKEKKEREEKTKTYYYYTQDTFYEKVGDKVYKVVLYNHEEIQRNLELTLNTTCQLDITKTPEWKKLLSSETNNEQTMTM
jgi:hypothetical protein